MLRIPELLGVEPFRKHADDGNERETLHPRARSHPDGPASSSPIEGRVTDHRRPLPFRRLNPGFVITGGAITGAFSVCNLRWLEHRLLTGLPLREPRRGSARSPARSPRGYPRVRAEPSFGMEHPVRPRLLFEAHRNAGGYRERCQGSGNLPIAAADSLRRQPPCSRQMAFEREGERVVIALSRPERAKAALCGCALGFRARFGRQS